MRRWGEAGVLFEDVSDGAPAWVTALGVLALAGAVAAAAHGAPAWAPLRAGIGDRWLILIGVLALAALVFLAALVLTVVLHRTLTRRGPAAPPLWASLVRAAPFAAVALAVLALLAIGRAELHEGVRSVAEAAGEEEPGPRPGSVWGFLDRRSTVVVGEEDRGDPETPAVETLDPSGFGRPLLLAIGTSLLAILTGIAWRRYRRGREDGMSVGGGAGAADEDVAREAVAATIDAMLANPDPRTAVIGAYARLLEGFAACGGGRHAHEAPMEHLSRLLTLLQVRREPVRALIELFEIARFSTHPLTPAHRDRALAALRAVAVNLAERGAVPGAERATRTPAGAASATVPPTE